MDSGYAFQIRPAILVRPLLDEVDHSEGPQEPDLLLIAPRVGPLAPAVGSVGPRSEMMIEVEVLLP